MRIVKQVILGFLVVALVPIVGWTDTLQPGEQAIQNCILKSVSSLDRRRAGRLRAPAYLFVTAEPAWAKIFIDGRKVGKGTAMFTRSKGSPFVRIRITAPDHQAIQGWLRLKPKIVLKVRAKLHRRGGNLTLLTPPAHAKVKIDGIYSGVTPVTISNLDPGPHKVEMSAGAWQWQAMLQVKAGQTQVLSMNVPSGIVRPAQPAPVASPAPAASEPRAVEAAKPAPGPQQPPAPPVKKTVKVDMTKRRPNCKLICAHYADASHASKAVRQVLKSACMDRCNALDLPFSVCAWKAKSMSDIQKCQSMPASR